MKRLGLQELFWCLEVAWLRWALREIDPLHPDVRYIVPRLRVLEDRRA